jgi:transcriptional regulator with AAA-type ATPase domain/pSer/pThr/pTyr-binding forkhead associated (FHA) protein
MKAEDQLDQTSQLKGKGAGQTPAPLPKPLEDQTQLFSPGAGQGGGAGRSPGGLPKPLLDDGMATVAFKPFTGFKKEDAIQPTVEVVTGLANEKVFNLGPEKLTIGRSNYNALVLDDEKVSRSHAEIHFEDGYYVVEDLNSTNGVQVNEQLIHKMLLKSGDRITLGDSVLLFTQKEPEISLGDKVSFINKSDLLNWLDQETKILLAQNLVVRFFPKNAVVQAQNTLVESMYFLYSGEIRIVEVNEEGGERNIDRLGPGDFFGEKALLAGESGNLSMIASVDLYLLELRKERLNELLQKKPELNQAFYRMVLKKLRTAQAESEEGGKRQDNLRHIITPTDVQIIGEDRKIKEAKNKIEKLAKEAKTALIIGPSGTGKKTMARYFHKMGGHPDYPYVEISLADLEESTVGAAIFGIEPDPEATHMKGQVGYLEMIESGTLAIAHAEQLDAHQQSILVTYLKYGWFHRVYGQASVKAQTKVILLATGTEAEVSDKFIPELKELLKDRIVVLPPLLQRLKDIPLLANHYLNFFSRKDGKRTSGLSREATEKLVSYTWPGNIKELENVIQRAAIVSLEDVIIPGDLIFVVPSEKEIHKINLVRNDQIRNFLRHPLIPKVFIWFNIFMVAVMAGFTLFGGSRPAGHPLQDFGNNPGMLITWLVWFPILPISAFLLGRVWCTICPIAGIGELVSRVKKFNLPVPKILKRLDFWVVVISFMVLDYTEEFFGVADKPLATGVLLIIIIGLSVLFCVLFERKTFCRYLCPLSGMLGTYSTMSILEVRGNKKVCQTQCGQHLCYKGTEQAPGCPMFSYPASISSSTECMMCLNCLKSCDNRGVQINLRPPLQELWRQSQPVLSLSLFGVIMVGLMARHQFPKLTFWLNMASSLGWTEWVTHTALYSFFALMAFIPFALSSTLSAAASQEKVSENMAHYGMAFIPLALAGHLSHVAHEFLSNGVYEFLKYMVKLYNSLMAGIPIGSQEPALSPFIHHSIITFLKVLMITGGMLGSLIALFMIARRISEKNIFARVLPHLLVLLLFFSGYVFIFTGATGAAPAPPGPAAAGPAVTDKTATASALAPAASQPQKPSPPGAGGQLSLTIPNVQTATNVGLTTPASVDWLRSAQMNPGTGKYRLVIYGQAQGAPDGKQVRAYLENEPAQPQFISPLDNRGFFNGYIQLTALNQRMSLILEVLDGNNRVLLAHKVLFS